jgi:hypothetical protein
MGSMSQPMVLLAGIFIGGLAMLCIISIISYFRGQSARKKNDKRDQIIAAVEETLADAESLITGVRSGRLTPAVFKSSLAEKLETVNHTYKPHIHQLDIFFVKYVEKTLNEHAALIGIDSPLAPQTKSVILPAEAHETVAASAMDFMAPPPDEPAGELIAPPLVAPAAEQHHEVETMTFDAPVLEPPVSLPPADFQAEPVAVPEPPVVESVTEEPVIAAMTQAADEENELPLETFLEMETGAGMIEEPFGDNPGLETQVRELESIEQEARIDEPPATPIPQPTAEVEETMEFAPQPDFQPDLKLPEPVAATDLYPPTLSSVDETLEFSPEASYRPQGMPVEPVAPPPPEVHFPTGFPPIPQPSEIEETLAFPPRMNFIPEPSLPEATLPEPIDAPVFPPAPSIPMPPPVPAFTKEEIAQPATIFDVEAETIIADRSAILGTSSAPAPEHAEDKKNLGITGEDVIDTFDKFFGIGR